MKQELFDTIEEQMKLASQLMEQAVTLKINADILADKNQELEKTRETLRELHRNNSMLMRSRLLSQWGLRVRYAHAMNLLFSRLYASGKDEYYTKDGEGPFVPEFNKELRHASSWMMIWNEVEKRVKHRYQMLCDTVKLSDAHQEEA